MSTYIKKDFSLLFEQVAQAQLYQSDIKKEHTEYMSLIVKGCQENPNIVDELEKPFQDQLTTAADQRDAYGHMISIIQVQNMFLENISAMSEQDIKKSYLALSKLAHNEDSLTGIPVTLKRTKDLFNELSTLLSSDHSLNAQEKQIAQRMQTACHGLTKVTHEMQSFCQGLEEQTQQHSKAHKPQF